MRAGSGFFNSSEVRKESTCIYACEREMDERKNREKNGIQGEEKTKRERERERQTDRQTDRQIKILCVKVFCRSELE